MRAGMVAMVGRDEDPPGAAPVPGYHLLARVGSGGAGEVWSAEGGRRGPSPDAPVEGSGDLSGRMITPRPAR